MKPRQNFDWVPPRPWTALIDTNIFKMLKMKLNGVHKKVYDQFTARASLGEMLPGLTLRRLEGGEAVALHEFRGRKHLVLEFGAVTLSAPYPALGPSRSNSSCSSLLKSRSSSSPVYVREPHAGEARFWRYKQPKTYKQKCDNAQLLVSQRNVTMPVLVDEMDELAHRRLGRLPNMVYVIDIAGRIVYKSMWTRPPELREFLRELVETSEQPTQPGVGV